VLSLLRFAGTLEPVFLFPLVPDVRQLGACVMSHKAAIETERQSRTGWSVYQRRHGWSALDLRDLWAYRDLLYFLTWRDVLVRYKQAVLGVAWAVVQPLLTMVVFTFVFNKALNGKSPDGVPYAVFSFSGLLAWQYFSGALSRGGASVVGSANLLTKVYFPRLVIPFSAVISGLVDFVISFLILLVLMGGYGMVPHWQIVFIPLFLVLAVISALAVGLWLGALNVLYRDVQYVIPFLVQLWMFMSPVIYSLDQINNQIHNQAARVFFSLNPMTSVIGGFRWALLGQPFPGGLVWVSIAVVVVLLFGGLLYFKRMERVFADLV